MGKKGIILSLIVCLAVGSSGIILENNSKNSKVYTEEKITNKPEQEKQKQQRETRNETVQLLEAMEGSYDEKHIILTNINKSEAEKIADDLDAEVKLTNDEKS